MSGREGWPDSNPRYDRTRQGLFIEGDSILHLCSPWGTVKLTGGGCGPRAFKQALLRRLGARFDGIAICSPEVAERASFYELIFTEFLLNPFSLMAVMTFLVVRGKSLFIIQS